MSAKDKGPKDRVLTISFRCNFHVAVIMYKNNNRYIIYHVVFSPLCKSNYVWSVMSVLVGNQLFEACQLFLSIRLEDTAQSWSCSSEHAAVCVCLSLSQCCSQHEASYGQSLHAASR